MNRKICALVEKEDLLVEQEKCALLEEEVSSC